MQLDYAKFFSAIRSKMHRGRLSAAQVQSYEAIIKMALANGVTDARRVAYILATARGEVGAQMQPIHEKGARPYFDKYEAGTKLGKALGNTEKGDGFKFRGRGYVQITGRDNYIRLGNRLGLGLTLAPDMALERDIAAKILVTGMKEGLFTGVKLDDFINEKKTDYVNARKIVNKLDRAQEFAGFAAIYFNALESAKVKGEVKEAAGTVKVTKPAPAPVPPTSPAPTPVPEAKPRMTPAQAIIGLIAAALAAIFAWVFTGGQN